MPNIPSTPPHSASDGGRIAGMHFNNFNIQRLTLLIFLPKVPPTESPKNV